MACQATTKAGRPCLAPELPGRAYCFHHDPQRATERLAARRAGGKAAHGLPLDTAPPDVRLEGVADCLALLRVAGADCLAHKPSLTRARTIAHVVQVALKVLELGLLEDRVRALEDRLQDPSSIP